MIFFKEQILRNKFLFLDFNFDSCTFLFQTETLLLDTETSEANNQQSQGSLFNPESFSQETDNQNDHVENNYPLTSLNAFLNTVNLSPVQRTRHSKLLFKSF